MTASWHCHDCFNRMPPAAVAGGIAVVIDVIRASTTITTALAHGAVAVYPRESVEESRRLLERLGPGTLAGGERKSLRIEGFDLGNSPREYRRETVEGRPIVFTTTNGTAALAACRSAATILVGGLVNRSAVAAAAEAEARRHGVDVHLVCAGTDGEVTGEDLLGAGGILAALEGTRCRLDKQARAALDRFRDAVGGSRGENLAELLVPLLAVTAGGRRMAEVGMQDDLPFAAAIDAYDLVPVFESDTGRLTPWRREPGAAHTVTR